MKTKNDSLIHVKLDYEEAVESKRDILLTEAELIKTAQVIKKYKELRMKEMLLRLELVKRVRDFKNNWRNTRHLLPTLELPKIIEDLEEEKHKKKKAQKEHKKGKHHEEKAKEERHHDNLELQLRDIQEKLNRLG